MRTIPNCGPLLTDLETGIRSFLNAITGRCLTDVERSILAMPCRMGGIGVVNPVEEAQFEYANSRILTDTLRNAIMENGHSSSEIESHDEARLFIRNLNNDRKKQKYASIISNCTPEMKRALELLQPKGTSTWLTSYPSLEHDVYYNQEEFRDALCLRYSWPIKQMPLVCECGKTNDINHALICKLGGFVIMRHNAIRDLEAEFLDIVCKDVVLEPPLLAVDNPSRVNAGSNVTENARLDIACRGFWTPMRKSFFDVRITHANADTNRSKPVQEILNANESAKKREYGDRVREIEHASFTPACFLPPMVLWVKKHLVFTECWLTKCARDRTTHIPKPLTTSGCVSQARFSEQPS